MLWHAARVLCCAGFVMTRARLLGHLHAYVSLSPMSQAEYPASLCMAPWAYLSLFSLALLVRSRSGILALATLAFPLRCNLAQTMRLAIIIMLILAQVPQVVEVWVKGQENSLFRVRQYIPIIVRQYLSLLFYV